MAESASSELAVWLALIYNSGLKLARVKDIVAMWCLEGGRPLSELVNLGSERVASRLGVSAKEGEQIANTAQHVPAQAQWLTKLEDGGIHLMTRADTHYPQALARSLPPATQPLFLFYQGDVGAVARPSAAVIGARDADERTVSLAHDVAAVLAEEGLAVISGFSKGVGQAAFRGALSSEVGQAIAVLPMGISVFQLSPAFSQEMVAVLEHGQGLLISPFHPDARFSESQAIARNKLMVGMAGAVFVVNSGREGVVWDTANDALRSGQAVYVWDVEPALDPTATGNQPLIQAGALPITDISDIFEAAEAIVATGLELLEEVEVPVATSSAPVTQVQEPETAYDHRAALELLSKAGHVPEVLVKRLRDGEKRQP